MTTARSDDLRALAQRVADALPADIAEEVVLTGSVSRGVADDISDIEMLVVTREPLELEQCFRLARGAGLGGVDTWGAQHGPSRRVSGYRDGVPLDLAAARIEEAALRWSGYAPAGLLTLLRPGDRLALTEWVVDAATRVLAIVFALNLVWQPTTKRLTARVAPLAVKPDRLAERIDEALTESDPRRALLVMTELQRDTVSLAQSGPNVDRARTWLAEAAEVLRRSLH
jgi:hypothetical protein